MGLQHLVTLYVPPSLLHQSHEGQQGPLGSRTPPPGWKPKPITTAGPSALHPAPTSHAFASACAFSVVKKRAVLALYTTLAPGRASTTAWSGVMTLLEVAPKYLLQKRGRGWCVGARIETKDGARRSVWGSG